jgi:integration host factor subunit alpha
MQEGLTKHRLAEKLVKRLEISQKVALEYVECLLETMKKTLESGESLKISGFGNFTVKTKADRRGRNPQTGETLTITSRKILCFKPSTIMKARINAV